MLVALKKYYLIILITLVGAILRFYGFADWSLSNDELSYLTRFHLPNAWEVFQYGMTVDVHPPAVQTFLYFWTNLFGDSPASIRFPFVMLGIATIPLIYLIGKNWIHETAGLLAATFLATTQYPLLFSRVARPYGFGMFVILVTAYFLTKVLLSKEKPRLIDLAGMAIGLAACAYTHYFCALSAAILSAFGLLFTHKENRRSYVLAGLAAVVLYLPYLKFLKQHLSLGGLDDWLPTPTYKWVFEYIFHAMNDSYLVQTLAVSIIAFALVRGAKNTQFKTRKWLVFAVFAGSFLVGFTYSVLAEPVMQYSGLMFAYPFLLLFFFGMINLEKAQLAKVVVLSLVVLSFDTVARQQFYTTEHYGVFKELAEKAIEVKKEHADALLIADVNHELYLNYYTVRAGANIPYDLYSLSEENSLEILHQLCKNSTADHCLLSWSTKGQHPESAAIVEHYFPTVIEVGHHFNSGYVLYSKERKKENNWSNTFSGQLENGWNVNAKGLRESKNPFRYEFTDSTEFGPTLEIPITTELAAFNSITVTSEAIISNDESQLQLVCSQHLSDGTDVWESRPFTKQLIPSKYGTAIFRFVLNEKAKNGTLKIYPWLPAGGDSATLNSISVTLNVRDAFQ